MAKAGISMSYTDMAGFTGYVKATLTAVIAKVLQRKAVVLLAFSMVPSLLFFSQATVARHAIISSLI